MVQSAGCLRKFRSFCDSSSVSTQKRTALSPSSVKNDPTKTAGEKKATRLLLVNLSRSLVMEEIDERSPVHEVNSGASHRHHPPRTRYEQILYDRSSSAMMLPERIVLPNGADDLAAYPKQPCRIEDGFSEDPTHYMSPTRNVRQ